MGMLFCVYLSLHGKVDDLWTKYHKAPLYSTHHITAWHFNTHKTKQATSLKPVAHWPTQQKCQSSFSNHLLHLHIRITVIFIRSWSSPSSYHLWIIIALRKFVTSFLNSLKVSMESLVFPTCSFIFWKVCWILKHLIKNASGKEIALFSASDFKNILTS